MSHTVRMNLDEVHGLAVETLKAHGCWGAQDRAIADTLIAADRDSAKLHGLWRIPFYVKAIRGIGAVPDVEPAITELAPSLVASDGQYCFAPLALHMGAEPLAEQGLVAIAMTGAQLPFGGHKGAAIA